MFEINIFANSILEKKTAVKKRRILVHPSTMFRNHTHRQSQQTRLSTNYNYSNQETAMITIGTTRQQQLRSVIINGEIWLHDQFVNSVVAASNFFQNNARKDLLQGIEKDNAIASVNRV